jgi:N-acetylglucosamine-6-phosphate deacetylase
VKQPNSPLTIAGGILLTPYQELRDHTLTIRAGRIDEIAPSRARGGSSSGRRIEVDGMWIIPGLIDIHVHGGAGFDTMDATQAALQGMARFFAQHGVTSYLPTTISASTEAILNATRNVAATPQPPSGARHLGVHLEGPYLNPAQAGAQPMDALRDPDPDEYPQWFETGAVKLVTLAPERPGSEALITYCRRYNAEVALGHTAATYEQVRAAIDAGARQATHVFNGMAAFHHRRPGPVGGVLADDRVYAQLIADLIHVHPAVVGILVRSKGVKRTILITDAMRAAGLADGTYDLGGQSITVRGGEARAPGGQLAGSTLTMDAAVRNARAATGLSLQATIPMATAVPAEAMGLAPRKGTLAPGADADVVVLDRDLNVRLTVVAGEIAFDALQG